MIAITPIPAFNDNYLWLIDNGQDAVVVDPGDANAVFDHLTKSQLNLVAILVTHHHADHTGGVQALKQRYGCHVIGPAQESIAGLDQTCSEGELISIPELDMTFKVLEVPGHTLGHIAYFATATQSHGNLLFCGDTLFSGGCGRLFEGTASQMWHSIQKIMALPDDTQIFPAHEYTLANLQFAEQVEPDNDQLLGYKRQVTVWRSQARPSLPAILAREKQINPFMRVQSASVITAAEKRLKRAAASSDEVFAAIRRWKDIF